MQPVNRVEVSDIEKNKKYYKTPKNETAFSLVWVPIKEYGIFVLPLLVAYLLLYFVMFEGGGKDDGNAAAYVIVGLSIIVVTVAAYILRKFLRKWRFEKFANSTVSVYKGNKWYCPLCSNKNGLLAPCVRCGVYPNLNKINKEAPKESEMKGYKKRNQKEYDEYKPQFEMDE